MNLIELNRSLQQLRLGGITAVLETRLLQAQAENMAYRAARALEGAPEGFACFEGTGPLSPDAVGDWQRVGPNLQ